MKNSQLIHIAKNEKLCSGKNINGVVEQPFDKKIMVVTRGLNQPF